MGQFTAIEPEYLWKVESLEDGSKLLTVQTEYEEIRIAWDATNANKLSDKMRSILPAEGLPDGSPDSNSGS